ncbi:MAG: serine hydrolase [Pyrinomonadaceae bacterium]|nr:serine hydrolase [Pyrinomonadaceae bacterium]
MNRKPAAQVRIVCLLLLALSLCSTAQPAAQTEKEGESLRRKLQEKLDEFHAKGKFPGATVGLALADGTSLGLAVGLSDVESERVMTPRDLMLQGSVGKTYVAALAMQLVQERKLGLDDPIEKYLGREKWFGRLPNARDITVRMLMNHTSGLVRYEFKEEFTRDLTANPDKVWKPEELVSYILDTKAPFAAGKGWDYSDTNYIVLGMIIERITGNTYYQELQRRILSPLKLRETVPSNSRTIQKLAQGYAGKDNPFGGADAMIQAGRMVINPQFEWTGGGIASTAEDLARWAKMLYEGKAFDASLLGRMLEGVPARLGPEAKYGLGVIIRPTTLGITYGHSGFFPGYITEVMYFAEAKVAIAVQVNTSVPRATGKPLSRFITELAEIVINEQRSTNDAEVMSVVNRLFAAMEAKQAEALRALFIPEGRLVSTSMRQGQTAVRLLALDDFLKLVMETKEPFRERMFDAEVRAQGDIAAVWGRYDFHVGERLTNCGHNSIQLVRVRGEWKIVNIASTIITQGCQETK